MNTENLIWQDALQRLIDGNERYVQGQTFGGAGQSNFGPELANPQPFACVLGCSDSRVVPEFVFDTVSGELFVVRVAGNVPNRATVGSIEVSITHMHVNLVVVLAHEDCAAVSAAVNSVEISVNTNHLIGFISESLSPGLEIESVAKQNARHTAKELSERSDIVREAQKNRPEFKVVAAYYHLTTGHVEYLT